MLIAQITTLYVKKSVNLLSGSIVKLPFFLLEFLTMKTRKIDIYDYLTGDELDQVTNIFLEALAREEGITPEVFELETNILVEAVYFNS